MRRIYGIKLDKVVYYILHSTCTAMQLIDKKNFLQIEILKQLWGRRTYMTINNVTSEIELNAAEKSITIIFCRKVKFLHDYRLIHSWLVHHPTYTKVAKKQSNDNTISIENIIW